MFPRVRRLSCVAYVITVDAVAVNVVAVGSIKSAE
jgi:hypothetical protein